MKTKLLRKLRSTYLIEKRNREYRCVKVGRITGIKWVKQDWNILFWEVYSVRMNLILKDARRYKTPKRIL